MGLTGDVGSAVSVLLQDVVGPTAAAVAAHAVLTQLVTHPPRLQSIAVVCFRLTILPISDHMY